MKTTILAGVLALASGLAAVIPTTTPTQAASLSIQLGESGHSRYDNDWQYRRHYNRGLHRGWYRGERRYYGMRRAYRDCEVTTHRYWRHGRLYIERERTCY
jgi:hypothetical protein